jgi:toxin ParE1/3/4
MSAPGQVRIELAPEVLDDFGRIVTHLENRGAKDVATRVASIVRAVQVLADSPLVGRPAKGGKRELVIGKKGSGFVALYRYVPKLETVFVLAVRAQRESGVKRRRT